MQPEFVHIDLTHAKLKWLPPCKRIYGPKEVELFKKSIAIDRISGALSLICEKISLTDVPPGVLDDRQVEFENAYHPGVALSNHKKTPKTHPNSAVLPNKEAQEFDFNKLSEPVKVVLRLLKRLDALIAETPPFKGPRRYGNMACRDLHDKLNSRIDNWIRKELGKWYLKDDYASNNDGDTSYNFETELKYYFLGSFGSRERLDFGTGHELSFLAFIASLLMCDILPRNETTGVEYLVMFSKYYDLVRKLIQTYTLEPAGSHGVWGLDDHFHLIYILGAFQMVDFLSLEKGEKSMKALNYRMGLTPASVLNTRILKQNRTRNLYYNAIAFIKRVKFGPFNEHSPLLFDVCTSKTWEKIAKGMLKMYYGEVLSKFPVVQHFYFGHVLFPWVDRKTGQPLPETSPEDEEPTDVDMQSNKYDISSNDISGPFDKAGSATNYRSGPEVAMDSLYGKREKELEKLHTEREITSFTGKRDGGELPTSLSMWPTNTPKNRNDLNSNV